MEGCLEHERGIQETAHFRPEPLQFTSLPSDSYWRSACHRTAFSNPLVATDITTKSVLTFQVSLASQNESRRSGAFSNCT
ncbi:hypothetical protein GQ55_6G050500 [Panicum hallii var. hallii]|uniref:Uncharacterized protein n=1 Tax=Panicum hallii var. hallii TaxID=1504633 RepID=A0A2T7D408_9POAL|nr:hypothetical protein GQ55_6G050500 [Panicum hallii var. hallii]